MNAIEILTLFDQYLAKRGLRLDALVTGWPAHVRATLADIGRRLGHDV